MDSDYVFFPSLFFIIEIIVYFDVSIILKFNRKTLFPMRHKTLILFNTFIFNQMYSLFRLNIFYLFSLVMIRNL